MVRCTAWLSDVQKKEKGSKRKKGRWMRDGRGRGWEMAEAECGINNRSATCYLAVAIMGSNVKLVARLSNPLKHWECTRVGNGGLKRRRKRS